MMALPERDCKFCSGTGYRMSRVIQYEDIRREIVEIMSGGGVSLELYPEALERADEIIDLIESRFTDAIESDMAISPECRYLSVHAMQSFRHKNKQETQ